MNTRSLARIRRATDEQVVALCRRAKTMFVSVPALLGVGVIVLVLGLTVLVAAGGTLWRTQSYQHTGSHIHAVTSAGAPLYAGGGTCSGGCGRPPSVQV
jgi:hypothetical protein